MSVLMADHFTIFTGNRQFTFVGREASACRHHLQRSQWVLIALVAGTALH
jgi:hypothetical protein